MLPGAELDPLPGRLAENVMHFARVLRNAGLPIGTDRMLLAFDGLRTAGIASRADLHAILAACFLSRGEHRTLFDQAFHIFWRDPDFLGRIMQMLMPQVKQRVSVPELPQNRRLAAALLGPSTAPVQLSESRIEIDAAFSWSDREQLRKVDFDTMTAEEWAAAQRMLDRLPALSALRATRRTVPAARGRQLDVRAMLRTAARQGGETVMPTWRQRRMRPEPLVVLVDISGSMSRYSRMFLHFMPRGCQPPRAHLRIRHTTDAHHAAARRARSRRGACSGRQRGRRLVGRHAYRTRASRIQFALGAARLVDLTDGVADHRRSRTRRH